MYAVVLAGGSGTRLWPLSREHYPKQYLDLGLTGRSLFQETIYRTLAASIARERLLVVTHRDQEGSILLQLKSMDVGPLTILKEPCSRNTAPAIGLAAWELYRREGEGAVMAVLPADHLVPDYRQFAALLEQGRQAAEQHGLVTFGVRPTYPETGYGYIRCGTPLGPELYRVERFVEKPDLETARRYLQDRQFLWNSGMFVFRVGELIAQYRRYLPEMAQALDRFMESDEEAREQIYAQLESISIDYGIMEKSDRVVVIPAGISWSDVGSWEAVYSVLPKDEQGNSISGRALAVETRDSLIISRSRLVGTVGVSKMVVVDTDDALLVCARERSQEVRRVVAALQERGAPEVQAHPTEHRPWGSFTVLEEGEGYKLKRLEVNPGERLSLQSHRYRSEHWVVVRGEGLITVDRKQVTLKPGESIFIPAGARHRLENRGTERLVLIEVQTGSYFGEDDIQRYEDDYGREV